MAVHDCLCDVDQLTAVALRVVSQHLEGPVGVECVSRHQDAFRLLDQGPSAESALKALVLREPLQGDVDRALQFVGVAVDDVGKDAALCRFPHIRRVFADSRAITGHDASRTISVISSSACSELRPRPTRATSGRLARRGTHFLDVDLAGYHVVTKPRHDLREQFEPVAPLVCDQDAEMLRLVLDHFRTPGLDDKHKLRTILPRSRPFSEMTPSSS